MFALGAGPVPALLLPEIFPDRIRAKGMAVAMCVHWVSPLWGPFSELFLTLGRGSWVHEALSQCSIMCFNI
jgi:hypothetical protein